MSGPFARRGWTAASLVASLALALSQVLSGCAVSPTRDRVGVDSASRGFVLGGRPFVPWGFNYDHDEAGRLLEDYWEAEWPKVAEDFREMKALGANVARVHLQVARFLEAADRPRAPALERLKLLLRLAEDVGLYLDVTGLGCYRKEDVPPWYDRLSEEGRWEAQASFWEAVASTCADSPAVFCYDLMNEPVSPSGRRAEGAWLGPPFGKYHYVQCISLDQAGRPRPEIARQWIDRLTRAIRKHDARRLITVGLVPWSLDRPGLSSGFVPEKVQGGLDFLSVHLYPDRARIEDALETLRGFALGKPVVIEETFPLSCSPEEFRRFLADSRAVARGWIGFYWGKTAEECRRSREVGDHLMLSWLEIFREGPNGESREAPLRSPP